MLRNINIGACEGESRLLRRGRGEGGGISDAEQFRSFGPHAVTGAEDSCGSTAHLGGLGNGTSN